MGIVNSCVPAERHHRPPYVTHVGSTIRARYVCSRRGLYVGSRYVSSAYKYYFSVLNIVFSISYYLRHKILKLSIKISLLSTC